MYITLKSAVLKYKKLHKCLVKGKQHTIFQNTHSYHFTAFEKCLLLPNSKWRTSVSNECSYSFCFQY